MLAQTLKAWLQRLETGMEDMQVCSSRVSVAERSATFSLSLIVARSAYDALSTQVCALKWPPIIVMDGYLSSAGEVIWKQYCR